MSDLERDLIEGLQEFHGRLKRGERIMATAVQQCGCWHVKDGKPTGEPKCQVCGGKGYIFAAHTILPTAD